MEPPKKLKITALVRNDGCSYHRVNLPLERLQSDDTLVIFTTINGLQDVHFQFADILFYNQFCDLSEAELNDHRKLFNTKIVVDMDDYWVFNHDHPNYDRFTKSGRLLQYTTAMRIADAVLTTHERLAEKIYGYNKNVHVVPNALPFGHGQFKSDRFDTAVFDGATEIGVMYAGGDANAPNTKIFAPVAKMLTGDKKADNITFQVCGNSEDNLRSITNHRQLKFQHTPWMKLNCYMDHYNAGDIAIAPMAQNTFSSMKSNIKVLEAAAKKIPIICSACHPYLGFPEGTVLYARTPQDWYDLIVYLAESPEARERHGNALYDYCVKHYHLDKVNETRLEILKSVVG